jgi:hypothetical protein
VLKPDGNYSGNLPVTYGMCNGRKVKILRDTGTTTVLVRRDLVPKKEISKEMVTLNFADNHSTEAPKANVYIKCPYFTGQTEAVCMEKLPFDVLIGNVPGALCPCSTEYANYTDSAETICAVQTRNQIRAENLPEASTRANTEIQFDLTSLNTNELIALQQDDLKLKPFFVKAGQINSIYPKIVLKNGVLLKLCLNGRNAKNIVQQILLPSKLKYKVMHLAHDSIFAGHLGIRKTQDRILSHFFWPGCYSDIKRYCRSCETCQKNAIGKPAKVPLVNLPVIDKPFYRVAVDIIGPLPKSHRGNRYALVSIDMATKYPDAVPLKRIDSNTVAEALLEIYSRVGLPSEILHDQGTQFMSSVMKKFNHLLQIKSMRTTPYNPKCNGTCEGFNKCLKQMLKKISDRDPQTWDRYLQPLLFAYREVPQASTGFSPFELLFGFEVRGPLFLIKERILDLDCETEEIPVTQYVMEMRERLKEFLRLSNENETASKSKEKMYYDRSSRSRKFSVGDKCLLLLPTSTSKLLAEWKGPYEIVRKLNKVDYIVRIDDKERTFHINMLKPFRERTVHSDQNYVNFADFDDFPNSFPENVARSSHTGTEVNDAFKFGDQSSNNQRNDLNSLLMNNVNVFSDVPGRVKSMEYKIHIDESVKP